VNYSDTINQFIFNQGAFKNSLLDEKRKLIYFYSPKGGSLSILKAFYDSKDILEKAINDLKQEDQDWLHLYRSPNWWGFAKQKNPPWFGPTSTIEHFENPSFKKIFFYRNVYDRAISCFNQFRTVTNDKNSSFNDYLSLLLENNISNYRTEFGTVFFHACPQILPIPPKYNTKNEFVNIINYFIDVEKIPFLNFNDYKIPFNKIHFAKGNSSHHILVKNKYKIYENNKGSKEKVEQIWGDDIELLKTTWEDFLKI